MSSTVVAIEALLTLRPTIARHWRCVDKIMTYVNAVDDNRAAASRIEIHYLNWALERLVDRVVTTGHDREDGNLVIIISMLTSIAERMDSTAAMAMQDELMSRREAGSLYRNVGLEIDADDLADPCVVCMDAAREVVTSEGCRHEPMLCRACAGQLADQPCPVCRCAR